MSPSPYTFLPVLAALALHLAGCAAPLSPEAQCFAEATAEYRAVWREARALRADLDRGYGLRAQRLHLARAVPCRVDGARSTCLHDGVETLALPVPIDRAALAGRLEALETELAARKPAAMAAAAPCGYGDRSAITLAALAPTETP